MEETWIRAKPYLVAALSTNLLHSDAAKVVLSFVLIVVVLIWLAAVYRGGAGDEEIERPVSLVLMNGEENVLVLAPRHLRERATHNAKAPRVVFYLQTPNDKKYRYKALVKPLESIRGRNTSTVYDHEYSGGTAFMADGGQVGIDAATRSALEEYFEALRQKDGRVFDADTATFVLKLHYPPSVNLKYLLQEHPDPGVRVGAWIFVLTSMFSIVQEWLFRQ